MVKGKRATKTLENIAVENVSEKPERPEPPPAVASAPAEPPQKISRISIPVGENGSIAWETMRLSTQDELIKTIRASLVDKEFVGKLGFGQSEQFEIFDAGWTGSIYDALGAIESYLAQRMYGVTPEIARKCFNFSDLEKEKLAKPTAKLLNKWALRYDFLVRFKEEIAVAMLVFAISSVKFKMAAMMMDAERTKQKAQREPAQVVNGEEKKPAPIEDAPLSLQ